MTKILIDMNYPHFQNDLFLLKKLEQRAFLNSLKKIKQLIWEELHRDKGIRWKIITSRKTSKGFIAFIYYRISIHR